MAFSIGDLSTKYNQMQRDLRLIKRQKNMLDLEKIVPAIALPLVVIRHSEREGLIGNLFKKRIQDMCEHLVISTKFQFYAHYHVNLSKASVEDIDRVYEDLVKLTDGLAEPEKIVMNEMIKMDRDGIKNGMHQSMYVELGAIDEAINAAARDVGYTHTAWRAAWQGTGQVLVNVLSELNSLRECKAYVDECDGDSGGTPKRRRKAQQKQEAKLAWRPALEGGPA